MDPKGRSQRVRAGNRVPGVRFEKWQALGNDYVIVEAEALPWELTAARVRLICDPHFGVGSDGILLLSRSDDPAYVAELRIFNPDGSEAELSGNGAREAILYLRRQGWTDEDTFTIRTAAGPITPTITSERTCSVDMGRAATESKDFPAGERRRQGQHSAPTVASGPSSTSPSATRSARSKSATSLRTWTFLRLGLKLRPTRCFRIGPMSLSSASREIESGRGSLSVGWGRPSPPAPGPAALQLPPFSQALPARSWSNWMAENWRSRSPRIST